jgi:hypothetical protein
LKGRHDEREENVMANFICGAAFIFMSFTVTSAAVFAAVYS